MYRFSNIYRIFLVFFGVVVGVVVLVLVVVVVEIEAIPNVIEISFSVELFQFNVWRSADKFYVRKSLTSDLSLPNSHFAIQNSHFMRFASLHNDSNAGAFLVVFMKFVNS